MNNVKLGTHESVNESIETESIIIERSGHRRNANLKKANQKMTKRMKQKGQEKIDKQLKQQQQKDAQKPKQMKKYEFIVCDKDKNQIKTFGETELENAKDYAIDDKNAMYVLIVPEGETDTKKGKAVWTRKDFVGDLEYANELRKVAKQAKESMEESKELKENWYRGCKGVKFIWHGEWSDPELEYDGKIFNYWDVEDALWGMFLDDTDYVDGDAGDPRVEKEFDRYVQRTCRNYLDDLMASGYFGESIKESVNENELLDAVEYSYGMDEEEAKALIATLSDKSKEEIVRGWKQDAKADFHENLNEGNEEFPYIGGCKDFRILKGSLSDEALKGIEAEIEDFQDNYMKVDNVREYEEKHDVANKGFPDAVLWYEGLITTEDLIDYARDVYGQQDKMEESLKLVTSIADYEPWGGAIEHWKELQREGYTQKFEDYMEDIFPEGITMTQLNDALWFDWDEIREDLGMLMEESLKEDAEEETTNKRDIMFEIRDIYQNGDLYFDVTEDDFIIFDDWKSVIELEKALKPDFEPKDKWDDSVLRELGVDYGFSDEWARCDECGKAVRTAPDSYSWKADFFLDDQVGGVICGDDVRKDSVNYINWLLESPANRANTILSDSDLESEGFEKVSEEYESGWYDRHDDPKEILTAAEEEYPNGEFIFSISRQGQFATNFELWVRRPDEYEESLKEDVVTFEKKDKWLEEKGFADRFYFDGVDLVDKNANEDTGISVGKNGVQSDFLEKKISEYVIHKDGTNERTAEEALKEDVDVRPTEEQKELGREWGWEDFEVEHGYGIFQLGWNYAPLDVVCRIDDMDVFSGDLEAVEQAKRDGYKFIDFGSSKDDFYDDGFDILPEQILDTEENRKNVEKYYMHGDAWYNDEPDE